MPSGHCSIITTGCFCLTTVCPIAIGTTIGTEANVELREEFDEGHLKCDPAAALEETRKMSAIMEGSFRVVKENGMNPIRYLWQTVCDRVRLGSSEGK